MTLPRLLGMILQQKQMMRKSSRILKRLQRTTLPRLLGMILQQKQMMRKSSLILKSMHSFANVSYLTSPQRCISTIRLLIQHLHASQMH
nr:hypothetical protein Iba_chr02bCG6580 [Ipomoea batatas]